MEYYIQGDVMILNSTESKKSVFFQFIKMSIFMLILVIIGYAVIIGIVALIATEVSFIDLIVNAGIEIKHIIQRIQEAK